MSDGPIDESVNESVHHQWWILDMLQHD